MITERAKELNELYQERLYQYNAAPSPTSLQKVSRLGYLLLEEVSENCTANDAEERSELDEIMEGIIVTGNMLKWVLEQAARNSGVV